MNPQELRTGCTIIASSPATYNAARYSKRFEKTIPKCPSTSGHKGESLLTDEVTMKLQAKKCVIVMYKLFGRTRSVQSTNNLTMKPANAQAFYKKRTDQTQILT